MVYDSVSGAFCFLAFNMNKNLESYPLKVTENGILFSFNFSGNFKIHLCGFKSQLIGQDF